MKCTECKKAVILNNLTKEAVLELKKLKACQSCCYWLDRIKRRYSKAQVIANGIVYQIDPKSYRNKSHHGHSGKEFTVLFNDGRIVATDNLWYNGKIEDRFIGRLPDNAKII